MAIGTLLATQLLLAQGALALSAEPGQALLPSARKVLGEIRVEIRNIVGGNHPRINTASFGHKAVAL